LYSLTIANISVASPAKKSRAGIGGGQALLTPKEEEDLQDWILLCDANNTPQTKSQILLKVQEVLSIKKGDDRIPSNSWWKSFRKRHPQLVIKRVSCSSIQL